MTTTENLIERDLIAKLQDLKYTYRPDIRDRATLEKNFREKFETLNRIRLADAEFQSLLEQIITPDVFAAAKTLRERNSFTRDDGTPLNYTLVNIKDWCKNTFEVVNQLRINTDNSHHRYDVILLINGVPVVQIELKSLGISPRRAMEQIVDYRNNPGNGYTKTLLCFMQVFIVSNRSDTWYFANNNSRHFSFNADERFLPVYQFATEDNKKITHLDNFSEAFLSKCTLGQMISRYMVLIASEQKLMMMRPYLRAMGIDPILERQPDFSKRYLGHAQSAFYGGRTSAHIRKASVPVVYTDFLSMYPTVNSLMNLWSFVTARKIGIIEHCQEEIEILLRQVTADRMFEPAIWKQLTAFVRIIPDGDILPTRGRYSIQSNDWQVAVNHLYAIISC